MAIILIRKNNYKGHGSKGKLIRDLTHNLFERTGEASVTFAVSEIRLAIKDDVSRILGKKLYNNSEVENALLGDKRLRDGEIVITRINGVRCVCFRNKEVMLIFETVCELLKKKLEPTVKTSVAPLKRAM